MKFSLYTTACGAVTMSASTWNTVNLPLNKALYAGENYDKMLFISIMQHPSVMFVIEQCFEGCIYLNVTVVLHGVGGNCVSASAMLCSILSIYCLHIVKFVLGI
jgi:hypothetical protein